SHERSMVGGAAGPDLVSGRQCPGRRTGPATDGVRLHGVLSVTSGRARLPWGALAGLPDLQATVWNSTRAYPALEAALGGGGRVDSGYPSHTRCIHAWGRDPGLPRLPLDTARAERFQRERRAAHRAVPHDERARLGPSAATWARRRAAHAADASVVGCH